jgi:hypothetical protein
MNRVLACFLTIGVLLGLSVVMALKRESIATRYYVWRLCRSASLESSYWVQCVCRVQDQALPRLVDRLRTADAIAGSRAADAIIEILGGWDGGDERLTQVARALADTFDQLSTPGQVAALKIQAVSSNAGGRARASAAAATLVKASKSNYPEVHAAAMELACQALGWRSGEEVAAASRQVIRRALENPEPEVRIRATRLATVPEVNSLGLLVPLLSDSNPEVRREVMIVLGPAGSALGTDELLPWLHDSDSDVRFLCEKALRARGLREEHIRLGRLITDANPQIRLQVVALLGQNPDLEIGVWLRRLSHDPSAAVRAAAIRGIGDRQPVHLTDRLVQLSENDPCATIRQLAHFYLQEFPSLRRQAH